MVTATNYGCDKDKSDYRIPWGEVPTVVTNGVTNITQTTADCSGTIINAGSDAIKNSGISYHVGNAFCSTGGGPLSPGTYTATIGDLISSWCDLEPNTVYYYSAYATNSWGTGHGEQKSFKTLP